MRVVENGVVSGMGRAWVGMMLASTALTVLPAKLLPSPAHGQPAPVAGQFGFHIPAQPLADALTAFGQQSGMQVTVDAALVRGAPSAGASGAMTSRQALDRLLAGTGLGYRIEQGNTVVLERLPQAVGALRLPEINIDAGLERGWSPVRGYVARVSATATRTDTPIVETPQSLSVITRDQMAWQGPITLEQTVGYTPGAIAGILGPSTERDKIYLRGFEPNYYLDGLMLPYGAAGQGARIEPYGLERIEILRGPSSVMFGQGAPGGIVNMISRRPSFEPLNEIELQIGNRNHRQLAFDISGPIDADRTLAYRLTGLVRGNDTQVDFVEEERIFIAPAFTWRPNDNTTLTILGQYQHDSSGVSVMYYPAWGTLYPNPNGAIRRGTNVGEPDHDRFNRNFLAIGYQFEHRFSEDWIFRQALRYTEADVRAADSIYGIGLSINPATGLPSNYRLLNRYQWDVDRRQRYFTVDSNLQHGFATGPLRHELLFGIDYRHSKLDQTVHGGLASPIDIFAPVHGRYSAPGTLMVSGSEVLSQVGLYLQDQIRFDRWLLTLSGRYDMVDGRNHNQLTRRTTRIDDNAFTWRAGLSYVMENGIAPYVSYATSFQPIAGAGWDGGAYEPTTGRQYEVGIKYQPPGSNILLTAAAYHLRQQNVLTRDQDHPGFNVQTGEVRVRGLELEARASLAEGLNLILSYAYTDATITESNVPAERGNRHPLVAPHQASAWLDYTWQEGTALAGLGLGGGLRHVGPSFGDNANTLRTPGYTLVDLSIRYDIGQALPALRGASLGVTASNIFDKEYLATCAATSACFYGNGRTVLASLRYRW